MITNSYKGSTKSNKDDILPDSFYDEIDSNFYIGGSYALALYQNEEINYDTSVDTFCLMQDFNDFDNKIRSIYKNFQNRELYNIDNYSKIKWITEPNNKENSKGRFHDKVIGWASMKIGKLTLYFYCVKSDDPNVLYEICQLPAHVFYKEKNGSFIVNKLYENSIKRKTMPANLKCKRLVERYKNLGYEVQKSFEKDLFEN